MNTDSPWEMLLHEQESEEVIGIAFEVLNELGHGLLEKPYENAMAVELRLRGVPFEQQVIYDVMYKEVSVGTYIPDLIVRSCIIVDAKTIDRIGNHEVGQMLNYLRLTGLRVGLILNFKRAKLEWKRVVL
ncbi:MAG: GxxExxY protein [Flavobacteriales bacterium]|nr:GxxExxY protein [Flavobacteriales bacterium]